MRNLIDITPIKKVEYDALDCVAAMLLSGYSRNMIMKSSWRECQELPYWSHTVFPADSLRRGYIFARAGISQDHWADLEQWRCDNVPATS